MTSYYTSYSYSHHELPSNRIPWVGEGSAWIYSALSSLSTFVGNTSNSHCSRFIISHQPSALIHLPSSILMSFSCPHAILLGAKVRKKKQKEQNFLPDIIILYDFEEWNDGPNIFSEIRPYVGSPPALPRSAPRCFLRSARWGARRTPPRSRRWCLRVYDNSHLTREEQSRWLLDKAHEVIEG